MRSRPWGYGLWPETLSAPFTMVGKFSIYGFLYEFYSKFIPISAMLKRKLLIAQNIRFAQYLIYWIYWINLKHFTLKKCKCSDNAKRHPLRKRSFISPLRAEAGVLKLKESCVESRLKEDGLSMEKLRTKLLEVLMVRWTKLTYPIAHSSYALGFPIQLQWRFSPGFFWWAAFHSDRQHATWPTL